MTSQLRHHYIVSCKYWWDILQFFSHTNCHDLCCKNSEKLSKFIEVTTKILLVLFFWTQCRWWFFIFSLTAFNIKLKTVFIADRLQGQICIGCKYWFVQWSHLKIQARQTHSYYRTLYRSWHHWSCCRIMILPKMPCRERRPPLLSWLLADTVGRMLEQPG